MEDLVVATPDGLYCPAGGFHIDPWRPVGRAIVTHAHSDHARLGSESYLCSAPGEGVLTARLPGARIESLPYGERIVHNGVTISLHPAGHVLGSAQVRLEHAGQVWVVSGDYKLEADGTCAPFEPVRCNTFITESTFGLPIYRWSPQDELFSEMLRWWQANAEAGRASALYCYAFGKAQRILHGLWRLGRRDGALPGPVVVHGAMTQLNAAYGAQGVAFPDTLTTSDLRARDPVLRRALVLAPPSAQRSTWIRRFGDPDDAFASGWMLIRGTRRRRGVSRGFPLSDHADWPGLLAAIEATGASRIIVTHGNVPVLVRYLNERGWSAERFVTRYGEDEDEDAQVGGETAAVQAGGPPVTRDVVAGKGGSALAQGGSPTGEMPAAPIVPIAPDRRP